MDQSVNSREQFHLAPERVIGHSIPGLKLDLSSALDDLNSTQCGVLRQNGLTLAELGVL
jgi:hypothetical protein